MDCRLSHLLEPPTRAQAGALGSPRKRRPWRSLILEIGHRLLNLTRERDGVFARRADRPFYAFATDCLGLGGEGVTSEQRFTDGMHNFEHFVLAVNQ